MRHYALSFYIALAGYLVMCRFHPTVCFFEIWKKAFKVRSQDAATRKASTNTMLSDIS